MWNIYVHDFYVIIIGALELHRSRYADSLNIQRQAPKLDGKTFINVA